MCILVVERYAVCRCVHYSHAVDACAAYNRRGHEVKRREVLVGQSCSRHDVDGISSTTFEPDILPRDVSKLVEEIRQELLSSAGTKTNDRYVMPTETESQRTKNSKAVRWHQAGDMDSGVSDIVSRSASKPSQRNSQGNSNTLNWPYEHFPNDEGYQSEDTDAPTSDMGHSEDQDCHDQDDYTGHLMSKHGKFFRSRRHIWITLPACAGLVLAFWSVYPWKLQLGNESDDNVLLGYLGISLEASCTIISIFWIALHRGFKRTGRYDNEKTSHGRKHDALLDFALAGSMSVHWSNLSLFLTNLSVNGHHIKFQEIYSCLFSGVGRIVYLVRNRSDLDWRYIHALSFISLLHTGDSLMYYVIRFSLSSLGGLIACFVVLRLVNGPIDIECRYIYTSGVSFIPQARKHFHPKRQLGSLISSLYTRISALREPKLTEGRKRVRWQCVSKHSCICTQFSYYGRTDELGRIEMWASFVR